jgi:branched-chain amino acid transport system ATP-binding protein
MLELREMRISYGRVEVVHGIDLELGAGEVVGMIGPNGAGKSSILRAISGLVRPAAGEVVFEGKSLIGLAPEQIARLGLAHVPEGRHVFKTLTVAENLRLSNRGDCREVLERTLEHFPILRERYRQRADRLSGGEQQQLAIARALLGSPRLLILDEPSLGLAPTTIDTIYELLQDLREQGVTMLLIEQNAARTIDFTDRCVVLSSGMIKARGTREELQRNPDVLRAYLGKQP